MAQITVRVSSAHYCSSSSNCPAHMSPSLTSLTGPWSATNTLLTSFNLRPHMKPKNKNMMVIQTFHDNPYQFHIFVTNLKLMDASPSKLAIKYPGHVYPSSYLLFFAS